VNATDPSGLLCVRNPDEITICGSNGKPSDIFQETWGFAPPAGQEAPVGNGDGVPDIVVTGKRDKACEALRNNTEKEKSSLPNYITGNDNWNDPKLLGGYRDMYDSSHKSYVPLAGPAGQIATWAISVACAIWKPCSAAKVSVAAGTGLALSSYTVSALESSTAARVRALDARIAELNSGCSSKSSK